MLNKKKPAKLKIRKVWKINPKTRVKESKKIYKRKRMKQEVAKLLRSYNEE